MTYSLQDSWDFGDESLRLYGSKWHNMHDSHLGFNNNGRKWIALFVSLPSGL